MSNEFQRRVEIVPPNDEDAERNVLSAAMLDSDAIDRVSYLAPEDFYKSAHESLWRLLKDMQDREEPIDLVTVAAEAKRQNVQILDPVFIAGVATEAATSGNVEHHAQIVAEAAVLRRARDMGEELVSDALKAQEPSEALLGRLVATAEEIGLRNGEKAGPQPVGAVLEEWVEDQANTNTDGIRSGIDGLDRILGGFQRTDLITCAARPGMGKSGLGLSVSRAAAKKGKRVLRFDLEMGRRQTLGRLIAQECEIELTKAQQKCLSDADWELIRPHLTKIADWDLHIDDEPGLHITTLAARARRLHKAKPLDLIVVDYLQLIDGRGRDVSNRDQELGIVSRGLKALAKRLDVPVLAFAQLSREVEKRADKRPILSDLRESGNIEQDSDVVMFIMRPDYYGQDAEEGTAELMVAKHRNGPTDVTYCTFDGPHGADFRNRTGFAGGRF